MRHTELEQLRACRKILARFHLAKDWIDSDGAHFDDDELVANIVLGGSMGTPGTLSDSLTWSELKSLAKMHEWLVRRVTREDTANLDIGMLSAFSTGNRGPRSH